MRTAYKEVAVDVSWGMPQPLQTQIAIRWSADDPSRPHHAMTAAPNAPPKVLLVAFNSRRCTPNGSDAPQGETTQRCVLSIVAIPPTNAKSNRRLMGESTCRPITTRRRRMAPHPPMALEWVALHGNLRLARGRSGLIRRAHPSYHSTRVCVFLR